MGAEVTKAQSMLLKYKMVTGQISSVEVVKSNQDQKFYSFINSSQITSNL